MNVFPNLNKAWMRRRAGVVLTLFALFVQLAVPVLHERDDLVFAGGHHAGGSAAELHVADWHVDHAAHHDAQRCSQCRMISQARSMFAPVLALRLPLLRSQWLDFSSGLRLGPDRALAVSAPRGPPLSA